MSVYKPAKSPYYAYDFQIRGVRFTGSTGCTGKRDAEKFEKTRKEEGRLEVKALATQESAPLNFATAAARYYLQIGQHLKGDGAKNCQWSINWLEREIGSATLLSSISDELVAKLVGIRRGEAVKNATVNRSVTEPLRKILNRARDVWGQTVKKIDWKLHMLQEPKERVREMSQSEEFALFDQLRVDYHAVVRFALLSGCRLCEIVPGKEFPGLRWKDVDWAGQKISVMGKGRVLATIPISAGIRELLFPLQANHDEFVFTYVAQRSNGGRVRGKHYPMTREGLKSEWRRSKLDAGLLDYRFHDNRHTAATGVLRATGNLKAVQKLLRHTDIATTAKYAHAMIDDVRDAMEANEKNRESRNNPRTDTAAGAKPLKAVD
ncbi:tyrosine-type recombinase/integrase [Bradyrhizobium sp. AZCC 1721]|uniref:tyrosine-type recombinase/integrase n=1 Tax=Bradyrhizobium sp. AZCC 1721 TaxID=3117016 RepID=UPI002FEEEF09